MSPLLLLMSELFGRLTAYIWKRDYAAETELLPRETQTRPRHIETNIPARLDRCVRK
jgi:hypothetical protein